VQELYVVNNTYVNKRAPSGSFLRVAGSPQAVRVINNLIVGSKTVLVGPGEASNNLVTDQPGFVDAAHDDYRLMPQSPAVRAGIDPGTTGEAKGFNLKPEFYYRHPLGGEPRAKDGLNIGACSLDR
jgi:hypothetical protein